VRREPAARKKFTELRSGLGWQSSRESRSAPRRFNAGTTCRLIRARGLARLSAWFAFGFTFSEVNRYTIEVDRQNELWRTGANPSPDLMLIPTGGTDGETVDDEGETVADGIRISGSLVDDVSEHLEHRNEKVASLLLIHPDRRLGRPCIRGAGDAVALAESAKALMRDFARRWKLSTQGNTE
jgi:hypothetical protein